MLHLHTKNVRYFTAISSKCRAKFKCAFLLGNNRHRSTTTAVAGNNCNPKITFKCVAELIYSHNFASNAAGASVSTREQMHSACLT